MDLSTQNHYSQLSNNKDDRLRVRQMIIGLSHDTMDNVPDDHVDTILISCIKFGFVEELRFGISVLKSPVE